MMKSYQLWTRSLTFIGKNLVPKSANSHFFNDEIIFHSNVTNDKYRKSIETDLIQMFKNFDCNILNCINKQPGLQNICYFTFQTEN